MSLTLSLAFFVSGHGYASYRKTLGKGLGLGIVSEKLFLVIIDAKRQMKDISPEVVGSWSRAVNTCDGCWLIRGHISAKIAPSS